MIRTGLLLAAVLLTACTPLTEERAEAICRERAADAAGPSGSIGIGVGTGGVRTGASVSISGDALAGRTPEEVYTTCITKFREEGKVGSTGGITFGIGG
ncbi:MAG: hypothetical protein AAGD04_14515 [Pseudomonadota bacterium]